MLPDLSNSVTWAEIPHLYIDDDVHVHSDIAVTVRMDCICLLNSSFTPFTRHVRLFVSRILDICSTSRITHSSPLCRSIKTRLATIQYCEHASSHGAEKYRELTPYFFSLPLEIRQRIYALVLMSLVKRGKGPAPVMIRPGGCYMSRIRPSCLPLLRVCRTIHREALPVLYGENVFQVSHPQSALAWLNAIGAANVGLVRSICIYAHSVVDNALWPRKACYDLLDKLAHVTSRLRSMEFTFDTYE